MDRLYHCSQFINKIWKRYLNWFIERKGNHIFLEDLETVKTITERYSEYPHTEQNKNVSIESENSDVFFDKYIKAGNCEYIPNQVLPKKLIKDIFRTLVYGKDIPDWKQLKIDIESFSKYLLHSNIILQDYEKKLRDKIDDTINILILGAGPTGMYIANYLHSIHLLAPRINLLILEKRVIKGVDGLRIPYTRNRIFGLNPKIFSSFFYKFPCIKKLMERGGIEIKYLENLLIILIYGFNIPIYFTNKISDQDSLKNFIQVNKIDVVFDATGKRFKNDFIKKIPKNFFPKNTVLENKNYEIKVIGNEAKLFWKDNMDHRYYISIEIYSNKGKFIDMPIFSSDITNAHDLKVLMQLNEKCITIKKDQLDELIRLFSKLKNKYLSKQIKVILLEYSDYNIKFRVIEPKLYHKLKISTVIEQKDHNTLFIQTGDTIFSSHYVIGAGLNRLLVFINQVIWSLQFLSTPTLDGGSIENRLNKKYKYYSNYLKYKREYLENKN